MIEPEQIAYVNARILDPASGMDATGSLVICGDEIQAVGPNLFPDGVPSHMKSIDCKGHVLCKMRYLQTLCMIWRGTPNRNNKRFNPKFNRTQDIANYITTKLEMCTTMQDPPSGMTAHLEPLENPNLDN